MPYQRTSETLKSDIEGTAFSIEEYLAQRDDAGRTFTMAEIGHGGVPVAFKQPVPFAGERTYIGLENWMRGDKSWTQRLMAKRSFDDNVFFMNYESGGAVHSASEGGRVERWYSGPFDTESLLPDESCDEVFASNVFCDPYLAYSRERTQKLLHEMQRVTAKDGMIVLRETITPVFVDEIDTTMLLEIGLQPVHIEDVECADPETWGMLEERYNGESMHDRYPGSYYLFLAKR